MPKYTLLVGALLSVWGSAAQATPVNPEIDTLRAEIRQMREAYEARLADLENRLKQAEARPDARPETTAPAQTLDTRSVPEISLVLQGRYAERKGGERHLSGFLAGGHAHGSSRGFSLDHTELTLAANIDPTLRGYANFAFVDEDVEVEEAWFQTLGLHQGLSLKGGRFLSGIGYANEQHPHAWDFADNSLMYQALFGAHLAQDGVQLKWLAPTEQFLELGMELGRGSQFPGSEAGGDKNGIGAWSAFAHVGGDWGDASSWRAGLSYLHAKPKDRDSEVEVDEDHLETLFTGKSRTWLADFVWKWAPDGNPKSRNLKLQAEYFWRKESGDMTCLDDDPDAVGSCDGDPVDAYASRQTGWYAQAVYQFMPRWRLGLRYDRLDSGSVDFGGLPLEAENYDPRRWSLMADYSPSEYARFRLQWARDHAMAGSPDNNQITLQYIHTLGAHGAHKF